MLALNSETKDSIFYIDPFISALLFLPEEPQEQFQAPKDNLASCHLLLYPFSSGYMCTSASNCSLNNPVVSAPENLTGGNITTGILFDDQAVQLLLLDLYKHFPFTVAAGAFPGQDCSESISIHSIIGQNLTNNKKATGMIICICRTNLMQKVSDF